MSNEVKISVVFATASARKEAKLFEGSLKDLEQSTSKVSASAGRSFEGLHGKAKSFLGKAGMVGLVAGASGAVVAGYNRMMDKGAEFEQQLADLSAITGISGTALERLGNRSLKVSVKYGESASNIIEANKLVASQLAEKIDFGTEEGLEQLQQISEQAVVLQKAAGVDLATAVTTLTTVVNQFNLPAGETERLINSIAAGSKYGAAEVADQAAAIAEAGSVAASANIVFEELNGSIQILAQNAIKGSKAGVGVRNVLLTMGNEAKLAEAGIEGVNLKTDGFAASLEKLKPLLNDSVALEKLFGRESITAAQILIKNAESVAEMTDKVTGGNVAYEQAAIQLNTYKGATDQLAAAIDAELIPAFQEVNGVGVMTIDTLTNIVKTLGQAIEEMNEFVSEADRISNILEAVDNRSSKLNENIKKPYETARKILEELVAESSEYETSIKTASANIQEFTNQLEGLEEGSKLYEAFNSKILENKEYLEDTELALRGYVSQTEFSIKLARENGEATGLLEEQLREYLKRLTIAQEELAKFNDTTEESTEVGEVNEGQLVGLAKQYKDNKDRIDELINSSTDLTKAEWDELAAKTAKNEEIKKEIERRKELVELMNAPKPSAPIGDDPEHAIIEPDLDISEIDLDTEQFSTASEIIRQLDADLKLFLQTSKLLQDQQGDIGFSIQSTQQAIADLVANGYSAQDEGMQMLIKRLESLKQAQGSQLAFTLAANDESIKSFTDLANHIRSQVLNVIQAKLSEALAIQVTKVLRSVPFPFNIAAAAAAGGAVKMLFNNIPKFNTGGVVPGPASENTDTVPAMLTPGEYVVRKQSSQQAPRALRAINASAKTARAVERFVTQHQPLNDGGLVGANVIRSTHVDMPNVGGSPASVHLGEVVNEIRRQTEEIKQMQINAKLELTEFHELYEDFKQDLTKIGRS